MEAKQGLEFARDVLSIGVNMGKFLGSRLVGGAWGELPPIPENDIIRPARIEHIKIGE